MSFEQKLVRAGGAAPADVAAAEARGYERGKAEGLRLSASGFDGLRGAVREARAAVTGLLDEFEHGLDTWQVQHGATVSADTGAPAPRARQDAVRPAAPSARPLARASSGPADPSIGNSGLRRILIALAQRPGLSQRQLGLRAGLSSRSGTFATYLSKGRSNGWIEGSGELRITDAGLTALGAYEPLPEGRALLEHWLGELGESGAARILGALAEAYPRALSHGQVGEAAGLSERSGTFATYLSRLRTLELVTGRGELRASEELFD